MLPQEALPDLTWRVLELTPDVVSTGSVLLGGNLVDHEPPR